MAKVRYLKAWGPRKTKDLNPGKGKPLTLEQKQKLGKDDFWYFATHVLENQAYDKSFHGLLAAMVMHGVTKDLPIGDYYFPNREDLVIANGKLDERYRLKGSDSYSTSLDKRLRLPPTALDGSFRGFFMRVVPPEEAYMTIVMVPRGHLKTTMLTSAKGLWHLARNPREVELIVMNSRNNARNVVKEMKGYFEASDRFKDFYPEIQPPFLKAGARTRRKSDDRWQADLFDIPKPADVEGYINAREPSVTGHAIGGRLTSLHASKIGFDDLVDDKTIKTDSGIEQNITDYQAMLSLGIGDITELFYVGTSWHYADLSQWLLDPKLSGIKHANVIIATVIGHDEIPLYPKGPRTKRGEHPGFTQRSLKRLKAQQEAKGLWSSQYLNQPISSSQQSFKPEWYRWYVEVPGEKALATVMTCDPAISMAKQGDYTAFIVCTFDHDGKWYIREALRHRAMGVPYIIDTTYDLYDRYKYMGAGHRISLIGIETIGFQKTLLTIFHQLWASGEREELPIMPSLEPSKNVSKEYRIKRVTNHLKTGRIHLPAAAPELPLDMANQRYAMPEGFQALIAEGERFPKSSHDDMLDALAYVMEMPLYPEPPEEKVKETMVQKCRRGFKQAQVGVTYVDDMGRAGVDW